MQQNITTIIHNQVKSTKKNTNKISRNHCLVAMSCKVPWNRMGSRLSCPSLSPGVLSNSHPLSWWWHPITSCSVIPFSSCPQSFPASGSFPMSQFFASGGQSTGASASESVLSMNIQGWFYFRIGWFYLLAVQETLKSLLQNYNLKASVLRLSIHPFYDPTHICMWLLEKP